MKHTKTIAIASALSVVAAIVTFGVVMPDTSSANVNSTSIEAEIDETGFESVKLSMTTQATDEVATTSATTTTTSTTSTSTTETTTTTTSSTTTTTETTTVTETTTTAPAVTEAPTNPPEYEYSWSTDGEYWYFEPSGWAIDNKSYYVLCNCVANEAGCNWISTYDKALVCEVIFNRLNNGYASIYDVVAARDQFTGSSAYVNLECYSGKVTDDVISAVAFYCSYPEIFNHGYYYFRGDGYQNHFS